MTLQATKIRTIRSYTGLARFLADTSEEPIGEIPSSLLPRDRYSYSTEKLVRAWTQEQIPIAWSETAHKTYEVFRIDGFTS